MIIANGSTDVTTYWVLRDSTTHAPKTSVTITDIDIYYVEAGAAISAKADLTALAAADSAHGDNKGYEIGQGLYRIDWPDAAFDGGIGKHVILIVVCSGVDTVYLDVELSPSVEVADKTGFELAAGAITASVVAAGAIDADALAADAAIEIADAILARDLGSGSNAVVAEERTVRAALRFLRNKWSISGTTLTVTTENDTTTAWTSTLAATSGADPVTSSDPT